jgi:hypothetical protein
MQKEIKKLYKQMMRDSDYESMDVSLSPCSLSNAGRMPIVLFEQLFVCGKPTALCFESLFFQINHWRSRKRINILDLNDIVLDRNNLASTHTN